MSAKVRKIIGILDRIRVKYLFSAAALLLFAQLVFGSSVPRGMLASAAEDSLRQRLSDSLRIHSEAAAEVPEAATQSRRDRREQARAAREQARRRAAFEALPQEQLDSLITQKGDSLEGRGADTIARDTVKEKKPQKPGAFLDDPISGKNKDSLVYDVRNKMVYIYNEGDITYQNSNLKADYMQINMDNKMVYAYGKPDSLEGKPIVTKPEFSEGDASYTMDTITYNLTSKKAKIKGVATQQGDGWLVGGSVKKMPDNTVNIENGKYTTCDETDHPHFYLAMTKAKVIPGKKVVTGPAYLVMEDVPIYFLGIPEGFFPINMGPKSGLLMPPMARNTPRGSSCATWVTISRWATTPTWPCAAGSTRSVRGRHRPHRATSNVTSTAAVSTCSTRTSRRAKKANRTISSRATSASSGHTPRIPRPTPGRPSRHR